MNEKIKELEKRIEKLESKGKKIPTDRFGKPFNSYDLSQVVELRKKYKN